MAKRGRPKKTEPKAHIVRVDGRLHKIHTVRDDQGKILHKIAKPLHVEFHLRDLVQIIVGSTLLAIPVGFTEETWRLGATIPSLNVAGFLFLSLLFISTFTYYTYYSKNLQLHVGEFIKRVSATYLISLFIVGLLLTLIQQAPWMTDFGMALKRVILVGFPASMSAAVADMIK